MAPSGIPSDLPEVMLPYQALGLCLADLYYPLIRGNHMDRMKKNLECKEGSASGDSNNGSHTKAPQIGAAVLNPVEQGAGATPLIGGEQLSSSSASLENLEGLTEKVGTLGLQTIRRYCCGAAKRRVRRAKHAGAPAGGPSGGGPWSTLGGQSQTLQEPSTSGAQYGRGPSPAGPKSPEDKGHLQGPSKRQRPTGGTPGDGRAKRPTKQTGQHSYARVAQEGFWAAIICEDYPENQISRENFVDIRLVDGLPEEGFTPRLADSYWAKGATVMVCQDEQTKDWLAARYLLWRPRRALGSRWWTWMPFLPTREWWPGFWALWRTRRGT